MPADSDQLIQTEEVTFISFFASHNCSSEPVEAASTSAFAVDFWPALTPRDFVLDAEAVLPSSAKLWEFELPLLANDRSDILLIQSDRKEGTLAAMMANSISRAEMITILPRM